MAEKLTLKALSTDLKSLSAELEAVRKKLAQMERQMNRKIDTAVSKALQEALRDAQALRGEERHGKGIDAAERQRLIAEAAYLMAESRGFDHGDPAQDWLNAEAEINRRLLQGDSP